MDQECMVLIKHCRVLFQTVHKKVSHLIVRRLFRDEVVSKKDSPGIGIYNKGWLVSSIKENAVSGLRSNPIDR